MNDVIIFGTLFLFEISLTLGSNIQDRSSYPDGPQGPDFAKEDGAMKVDLLDGDIEKYWHVEVRPSGHVNNEVQAYTKDAVTKDGSTITIKASKTGQQKPRWCNFLTSWMNQCKVVEIKSGRINSNGKWNSANSDSTKKRGYLEVRAKFPAKTNGDTFKGAWPAVWMLGTGNGGHWPGEGEIDIMESVNGNPTIHMSLHSTHHNKGSSQHPSGDPVRPNADFSEDGAILGLEWNIYANKLDLTWWISYFDLGDQAWKSGHYTKSLQKGTDDDYEDFYNSFVNANGFYAIINLAQGGDWPGCKKSSCLLNSGDQYVIVDSAKVYGV